MQFKTLKHKTLPDTFGIIDQFEDSNHEIAHGSIPNLQPMTATMELMKQYWEKRGQHLVVSQLGDYELVEVDVTIKKFTNNGQTQSTDTNG